MNKIEAQVISRKIFLKKQAIRLIMAEIFELRALLLRLKLMSTIKQLIICGFSHKLIGQSIAQLLYDLFGLKAD
jgi:hypothetical protein